MDLFEKIQSQKGPLQKYSAVGHGYYTFPRLEGEIGSRMMFRGRERIIWSLNNYLGLANHPEVRKADEDATRQYGLAYPMGARMMSGNTSMHEKLETDLAHFVGKEAGYLFNYGYQGIMSTIDCLVDRRDVVVYDSECHACIIDGLRLHMGKRIVFPHNDVEACENRLKKATELIKETNGAILLITEGVFGMAGDQGKLAEIVELKKKYNFRILVDDAHGFGTMGSTGAGTDEHQGCQAGIDIYFSTFAKSMASIGAFVAANKEVIEFIAYNCRSQIFAKSLPMPIVIGNMKRLELLQTLPELREKLWYNVRKLQKGLIDMGFDIGKANTPVSPVYFKSGSVPEATNLIMDLRENYNVFCSAVVYPVVPKGVLMLRLIPTAVHTDTDIEETLAAFNICNDKLKKGMYESTSVRSVDALAV